MPELSSIVIVGAGAFQLPAILEAKKMGFHVIALDADKDAVGFMHADKHFVVDIKDADACMAVVKDLAPVAVLALSAEIAVMTVAKICEQLGLKGVSVEAALNSTNKRRMRECFLRDGLPSPKFTSLKDDNDLFTVAATIGFPLVVKPADSAGSRGVSIVESGDKLKEAYDHASKYSTCGEILLEEYMEGVEISVEAFVQNNEITILTLSDKIRTPHPYPLDVRVIFPSNKPGDIQEKARKIAREAIISCGIDNAVIHMEMMVTADGPKLVEIAARGAGFHVFSKMIGWVCDINTVELLINISLGRNVDVSNIKQRGAVLSFPFAKQGIVTKIRNLDEVRKAAGINDAQVYVKEGDSVRELRSGSDRVAHIIGFGNDRSNALHIVDEAEQLLKIEVI